MIHDLAIGHIDPLLVRDRVVVVLRPLDESAIDRVSAEFPGLPIERRAGYVIAPWHGMEDAERGEMFAARLRAETACLVVDRRNGKLVEFGRAAAEPVTG